jgi:hypothetical protein
MADDAFAVAKRRLFELTMKGLGPDRRLRACGNGQSRGQGVGGTARATLRAGA